MTLVVWVAKRHHCTERGKSRETWEADTLPAELLPRPTDFYRCRPGRQARRVERPDPSEPDASYREVWLGAHVGKFLAAEWSSSLFGGDDDPVFTSGDVQKQRWPYYAQVRPKLIIRDMDRAPSIDVLSEQLADSLLEAVQDD